MKGYVVIDTEIVDTMAYSEYVEKIVAVIASHGGRFLVRSSDVETVEGGWAPKRLVVLEFASLQAANGFVSSTEYRAIDEIRQRAANSRIVVVGGYDSEG